MADLISEAELIAAWPGAANLDDDERAALITAACDALEGEVGRQLGQGTVTEIHRPEATRRIYLNVTPVASIISITYGKAGSTTVLSADDYSFDSETGVVELYRDFFGGYRYPDRTYAGDPRYGNLPVVYVGGYAEGSAPGRLKRAAILTARAMSGMGTSGSGGAFASEQIGSYSYRLSVSDGARSSGVPPMAAGLVRQFKRYRFA